MIHDKTTGRTGFLYVLLVAVAIGCLIFFTAASAMGKFFPKVTSVTTEVDGVSYTTFMTDQGKTVVMPKEGYDTMRRTAYKDGKADTDTYWIGDRQVYNKRGYWAYKRVYDAGQLVEVRNEGPTGGLIDNKEGYALLKRNYTERGREEYYYNAQGQPVALSLGQYGIRVEEGRTTYLGADGLPVNTTKGYAYVEKNGVDTRYFDKEGAPVTIGRGQYGSRRENGQDVYLDQNGNPMLRLDNILNTHPMLVLVCGVFVTLLAVCLKGWAKWAYTLIYVLFILYMTLAYRETGESYSALELFYSYRQFFVSEKVRQDILNNIWLFVPLGAALYDSRHPWRWCWCIFLSIGIEITQYFTGKGLAELDDIVGNSLGGFLGWNLSNALSRISTRIKKFKGTKLTP